MTEQWYNNWQQRLHTSTFHSFFWRVMGIYSAAAPLPIFAYLIVRGQGISVAAALAAFAASRGIISPAVYFFHKKPRPYQRYALETYFSKFLSGPSKLPNSFPSDHAISFASVTAALWWFAPWTAAILAPLAVLNGFARIILGYHDVRDIAAGWFLGAGAGILIAALFTKM